jgi:hypothetical protein
MTRRNWILVALAVVLGGLSLYLHKEDWFGKDGIQIIHRSLQDRPGGRRRPTDSAAKTVLFGFGERKLKLTSVKVIPVSAIQTNKYPHPIWELVATSNSVPVKEFNYGDKIRGMHPRVEGDTPDPLEPGVEYRLMVECGNQKASHDFMAEARTQ